MWAALAACGLLLLYRYSFTAGSREGVPASWPEDTRLAQRAGRPVLLVFAHPQCTCTRATLAVLSEIASELHGALDVGVVIADDGPDPATGEITQRARAIPHVRVYFDHDHVESSRFGAVTSGHTVLYDRDGRLVFAGGLTDERGQAGRSFGRTQILALIRGERATHTSPIFGCGLGELAKQRP